MRSAEFGLRPMLSMAAAEVAVGLALLILYYGRRKTLDADSMRGEGGR